MRTSFYLLTLMILTSSCTSQTKKPEEIQVMTDKGKIEGLHDPAVNINRFLGIPFAQPPVGELRWKAPQPMDPWDGILETKAFGPRAVQTNYWGDMNYRSNGMSEDCLYLNVWAPSGENVKDLPVLVYIYGGGFVAGDGSEPRYDGASMVTKGIIAVTMNYRLNIFGFFAHPELSAESPYQASGNYGLLDQQAALKWVYDNIAAFGGDPQKITLAGESAGSTSVSAHMASPLSRKMLAGAIGESGAMIPGKDIASLAEAELIGKEFAEVAGNTSLEELRALSTDELFRHYLDSKRFGFPKVLDGYFLPSSLEEIFEAGEQAQIPLLLGWNSAEQSGESLMKGLHFTPENYWKIIRELYPEKYETLLELYPGNSVEEVKLSATALASDRWIAYNTWKWADLHLNSSSQPVYRYLYSKFRPPLKDSNKVSGLAGGTKDKNPNAPPPPTPLGAPHACEIEYCLGNLPLVTEYAWTADDYKVSESMQAYFANFIKTGNPNGDKLPEWPNANASDKDYPVMIIDVESKAIISEKEGRYRFLDQEYNPKEQ